MSKPALKYIDHFSLVHSCKSRSRAVSLWRVFWRRLYWMRRESKQINYVVFAYSLPTHPPLLCTHICILYILYMYIVHTHILPLSLSMAPLKKWMCVITWVIILLEMSTSRSVVYNSSLIIHTAYKIQFRFEEDAEKAVQSLNNRWFNGHPIHAELSPVTDFKEACCRQYDMG